MNKPSLIADHKIQKSIALILICFVLVVFFGSIVTGFISPDSWNYLKLSTSLISGNGCQVDGTYFSVFPCGYPALISIISLTTGLDVFISSKIVNLILILSSAFFLYSFTRNILVTFVYIVNPITLYILQYTWSENVFILAITLLIYSLINIYQSKDEQKIYLTLILGLLLGITSRYFFAPYTFTVFITTWIVLGRKTALKVLPYFILSGVVFIAYYIYNKNMTGYGSGMPRIPAPESLLYLLVIFIKYSIKQLIVSIACLIPVLILFKVKTFRENIKSDYISKVAFFILSLGLAYLILAFVLRINSQYDLYGLRTVGFGYVLILTSIIYLIFNNTVLRYKHALALLFVGLLSTVITQREIYFNLYKDIRSNNLHSFNIVNRLTPLKIPSTAYSDTIEDDILVIPFGLPQDNSGISTNPRLYYKLNYSIESVKTAPYWEKENKDSFLSRIIATKKKCYFDFSRVQNIDVLNRSLESQYPVDISFEIGILNPTLIYKNSYEDSLSEYIRENFVAGKFVPCVSN